LIANTIKHFSGIENGIITQITIDFSDVDYSWGDGPAWLIIPWVVRCKVTFIAEIIIKNCLSSYLNFQV
jgi:hypothetical protein